MRKLSWQKTRRCRKNCASKPVAVNYGCHPQVRVAVDALRRGAVVAYPTEAVWGLGCEMRNYHGVQRILDLKQRPAAKGLILVADCLAQFEFVLHGLPADMRETLQASWPGPVTWLVPHKQRLPAWITGQHDTVALRVSRHPVVVALCRMLGGPIVSTSANPQGAQAARFSFQARRYFGNNVTYAPGRVDLQARPSVIRDLISGAVLRT